MSFERIDSVETSRFLEGIYLCLDLTSKHAQRTADEALRQELAAAETRRMAELQTVRNAHDFFGKSDWPQAARWCEKAAIQGDVPSQRYWVECLEKGLSA